METNYLSETKDWFYWGYPLADEYNLGEEYSDIFRSILYDYDDPQMAAEHALTHLGIL